MEKIIGFDSNILIYAYTTDEREKHLRAIKLLEKINEGKIQGFLSIQNINELFFVLTKKRYKSIKEAEEIVNSIINSNKWIIKEITKETTKLAIELSKDKKSHYWDNLISANLILNGVSKIYTENTKDFKSSLIKPINPFN